MKTYNVNLQTAFPEGDAPTVLVLGYFDGVHKGHQAVLAEARRLADKEQVRVSVLMFTRTPKLIFEPYHPSLLDQLTTPNRRLEKMAESGVDTCYMLDFTSQLACLSANDFALFIASQLSLRAVVVGFDYHFGQGRNQGSELAALLSVPVHEVAEVTDHHQKISSTRIRQALAEGQVAKIPPLLGESYAIEGLVVKGDSRGRTLGYPTANMALLAPQYLPKDGVYVTEVVINDTCHRAMTSIGENITFNGADKRIETHIFDIEQALYGQVLTVRFLEYLRPMVRFDSIADLIAQLQEDEKQARNWS